MSEACPGAHDPARRWVSFIGFSSAFQIFARIAAVETFMQPRFPDMLPNNAGKLYVLGFVEVLHLKQARIVASAVRDQSLAPAGRSCPVIRPALADIDSDCNWALSALQKLGKPKARIRRSLRETAKAKLEVPPWTAGWSLCSACAWLEQVNALATRT